MTFVAKKKEYPVTAAMHNPPHPGSVLKDAVIDALDLTVTEAAERLDVDRITLSRLINGQAAVSVEMALRLAKALNTTPDVWLGVQNDYDVWHTRKNRKLNLARVRPLADDSPYAPA
jgi:antitoxin HigA-1